MSTISELVDAEMTLREAEVISAFLPAACRRACVTHLAATIDVDACRTSADWAELDDTARRTRWLRSALLKLAPVIAAEVATDWAKDLNGVLKEAGFQTQRPKKLAPHIEVSI